MIWPTENPEVSQILPDIQRSFQDSEQITSFTLGVPILGRTLATPLQWSSIHFFRHRIIVPIPGNKIVPQLHRLFWCTLPLELVQALWTRQEDTWTIYKAWFNDLLDDVRYMYTESWLNVLDIPIHQLADALDDLTAQLYALLQVNVYNWSPLTSFNRMMQWIQDAQVSDPRNTFRVSALEYWHRLVHGKTRAFGPYNVAFHNSSMTLARAGMYQQYYHPLLEQSIANGRPLQDTTVGQDLAYIRMERRDQHKLASGTYGEVEVYWVMHRSELVQLLSQIKGSKKLRDILVPDGFDVNVDAAVAPRLYTTLLCAWPAVCIKRTKADSTSNMEKTALGIQTLFAEQYKHLHSTSAVMTNPAKDNQRIRDEQLAWNRMLSIYQAEMATPKIFQVFMEAVTMDCKTMGQLYFRNLLKSNVIQDQAQLEKQQETYIHLVMTMVFQLGKSLRDMFHVLKLLHSDLKDANAGMTIESNDKLVFKWLDLDCVSLTDASPFWENRSCYTYVDRFQNKNIIVNSRDVAVLYSAQVYQFAYMVHSLLSIDRHPPNDVDMDTWVANVRKDAQALTRGKRLKHVSGVDRVLVYRGSDYTTGVSLLWLSRFIELQTLPRTAVMEYEKNNVPIPDEFKTLEDRLRHRVEMFDYLIMQIGEFLPRYKTPLDVEYLRRMHVLHHLDHHSIHMMSTCPFQTVVPYSLPRVPGFMNDALHGDHKEPNDEEEDKVRFNFELDLKPVQIAVAVPVVAPAVPVLVPASASPGKRSPTDPVIAAARKAMANYPVNPNPPKYTTAEALAAQQAMAGLMKPPSRGASPVRQMPSSPPPIPQTPSVRPVEFNGPFQRLSPMKGSLNSPRVPRVSASRPKIPLPESKEADTEIVGRQLPGEDPESEVGLVPRSVRANDVFQPLPIQLPAPERVVASPPLRLTLSSRPGPRMQSSAQLRADLDLDEQVMANQSRIRNFSS